MAGTLSKLDARDFDYWKAQHLLNRAGFGGTPSQARALAEMGLDAAVDHLVDYGDAPTPDVRADDFDRDIMRPLNEDERMQVQSARRMGNEARVEQARRERQQRQAADRRQMAEIQRWWLERMIETARPLEEKMTLFWHGHFATGYRAVEDSYHMFLQNQFFRAHALGNFKDDLAHGIIRDPAMIVYLNNHQNRKQAPNENLAREFMELFTLGEGNDYTEDDIKEGARALTGYTYDDDEFVFRPSQHDYGEKRILGQTGTFDGSDFIELIFTKRSASEFLCLKLYRYLVNDLADGPGSEARRYIQEMGRLLRSNRYEVKPVLRAVFSSAHFYEAANTASQIKSPIQLVVQSIRSLRTPARSLRTLVGAVEMMGQTPFYPPSVKGWDGGRSWINTSTMFIRQNALVYLLTGRRPGAYGWEADGAHYDATHLVEHLGGTSDKAIHDGVMYLLRFALGTEPHPSRVEKLTRFVEDRGGRLDNDTLVGLLALITAMPEYQLC